MRERGLSVDHVTIYRWVQRYAPEINKRMRQHLKMSSTSYRMDETYVKVGLEWKYLYRAVDSHGQTIEFMLSAKRDVSAAKRFFKKLMRADHRRLPLTIGTDKHASYPEAFAASVKEKVQYVRGQGAKAFLRRFDERNRAESWLSALTLPIIFFVKFANSEIAIRRLQYGSLTSPL
jgi:transposase-like protein